MHRKMEKFMLPRILGDKKTAKKNDSMRHELLLKADAARDRREYDVAASFYREFLEANPQNPGHRVQYAHCLKEAGDFLSAEIQYRLALASGGKPTDIIEHLNFVCRRSNVTNKVPFSYPVGDNSEIPKWQRPPTDRDINALYWIMQEDEAPPLDYIASILRECSTLDAAAAWIAKEKTFVARNRGLLRVIKNELN